MAYFNRLPTVKYSGNDGIDLHKKLVLASPIETDWIMTYDLQDGETLHDVSYELYGTVEYWWLIALINQYDDVHYDMMIKDDVLQKLAKQLQVMKLPDQFNYILFPPNCKIEYDVEGKTYTATVIKKYIFNVSGEGSQHLIDVLLDNIDVPIPDEVTIRIIDTSLMRIKMVEDALYKNGDLIWQGLYHEGELEEFARGVIIYKGDEYLYVDKTKDPDFVVSGEGYIINDNYSIGGEVNLSKKIYLEGSEISEADKMDSFDITEFGLRDLYYIYRYDKLSEINDSKQKLTVIKPSYLNILKNNLIIIEEED